MSVSFNTIPSGIRVPLFYAEVDNSQAGTTSGSNTSLLVGQMLEGEAEPGVPVIVASAAQAKQFFGRGSQLARMVEAYRNQDAVGELVCIPLADAEGTAASCTVTVTGSATENGTVSLYVGADRVQVGVTEGDAAADVATAIKDRIAAMLDLPITATSSEGVVTINVKNKGTLGNDVQVSKNLRGLAGGEKDVAGLGVEISTMSGGATDPDVESAIAVLGDEPYEYIGIPYGDTAVLDAFATEMNDAAGRWSYARQLYGHLYTARRGELNELVSFGTGRNNQHETVFGIEKAMPTPIYEVLGAVVGRQAVFLNADPARPTQTGALNGVMASPVQSRFILTERQSLLTNGIATLTTVTGTVQIERAITTYQKNGQGDDDASYLDSETLHTSAYILRQLRSVIASKYGRCKLANDGTSFGAGQAIITPAVARGELVALYAKLERAGIVENADLFAKYLVVERNESDPNRLDVLFPPDLVNQLRIFAVNYQFRLQYSEE